MKKLKFVLGTSALLVAVGMAFASINTNAAPALQQLYDRQNQNEQCEVSPCEIRPDGAICNFEVYTDSQCTVIETAVTRRPPVK